MIQDAMRNALQLSQPGVLVLRGVLTVADVMLAGFAHVEKNFTTYVESLNEESKEDPRVDLFWVPGVAELRVCASHIKSAPPPTRPAKQSAKGKSATTVASVATSSEETSITETDPSPQSGRQQDEQKVFYAVARGRVPDVYYKMSDVRAQTADTGGRDRMKICDSLTEAERYVKKWHMVVGTSKNPSALITANESTVEETLMADASLGEQVGTASAAFFVVIGRMTAGRRAGDGPGSWGGGSGDFAGRDIAGAVKARQYLLLQYLNGD